MEQAYNEPYEERNPKTLGTPSIPLNPANPHLKTAFELDDELFIRKTLEANLRLGVELLYKRYYQPMCTHAVKFVGSREIAEDLVSEIFFQFYANKTFLEIDSSYRLYLFRTVRNRAYNHLRWDLSRKADIGEAAQKPILDEQQPDQISQFEELYHDVEEAVNKLPLERRRIYLMQKFEGKKYREIADELNLSVKTVDVQLTRANQYIRNLLKDKWLLSLFAFFTGIFH
ncbi:RNA polymerase sigma-70 factor [Runella aurantiaca]|uniref:RNA polymerase sigma-70 factor n=1 Tax=Runella aurantiaca TaxID=2282308 RepID=A0A369IF20_9BACT|nr:RNA polymerase sigma-70 factor [Runella aurantiaca]RDB05226.1 RNA polymerase sigma-70 factor [Runella aurantiaca]